MDDLLAQLPVKMSLSALVDELLEEFIVTVGPMVKQLAEAEALDRVQFMHQLAGQQMLRFGQEFAETVRAMEESAARKE